jgi:uncharacterized protein YjbI with pentapeptide repeats
VDPTDHRPTYRVLSTRTIALAAAALVVIGVGVATWLLIAYGDGSAESTNRLDAIKTAGTIVVGTGGAGALWLAARRQRTSEISLRQKDLDHEKVDRAHALQERMAAATEADAVERRITDLYTKAAEQLGSDKAPVRLAGLYALERLAQVAPSQRQTVVNLLCAYLRMPFEESGPAEERQVRLTAQRILATHAAEGDTHWPDLDLDLTGATLLDLDFTGSVIRRLTCANARLYGSTQLAGATLQNASFEEAEFAGPASFTDTTFLGPAQFLYARFKSAHFERTRFVANARFSEARFALEASFRSTVFEAAARYSNTVFASDVQFDGVRFGGRVRFAGTRFEGAVHFTETEFSSETRFDRAVFATLTDFVNVGFGDYVEFSEAKFRGDTRFGHVRFADSVRFNTTHFDGDARFDHTWVRLDVSDTVARAWPKLIARAQPGAFEVVPNGAGPGDEGEWGLLEYNKP